MRSSNLPGRKALKTLALGFWLIARPIAADGAGAEAAPGVATGGAEPWESAVMEGLRVGIATRDEVIAKFGAPDRVETYSEAQTGGHPIEWMIYESSIEPRFPGRATVWIDGQTRTLTRVAITPEGLSRERLLEELGPEFQMTRYRFCEELGDGESAPIYEDPSGSQEFMEYRRLGISIQFDWRGDVQQIRFLSGGFGIARERCPSSEQHRR